MPVRLMRRVGRLFALGAVLALVLLIAASGGGESWLGVAVAAQSGSDCWLLTGNDIGKAFCQNPEWYEAPFLGTINDAALVIRVHDMRALCISPGVGEGEESPNLIGGYFGNSFEEGAYGVTISGGGCSPSLSLSNDTGQPNRVYDHFGTVGGGARNLAGDDDGNPANNTFATIGGGFRNQAILNFSTVSGGHFNYATGEYSAIGGGYANEAEHANDTVGGGSQNHAYGPYSAIGGGYKNETHGEKATVSGGANNIAGLAANPVGYAATVGGGSENEAHGNHATVSGGQANEAHGNYATVSGGQANTATSDHTTVSGGGRNAAAKSYSTVPGGLANEALGHYSFAAGRQAKANHDGAFVWADAQNEDIPSTGTDQFIVRARGGIWLGTNSDPNIPSGHFIATSTGAFLTMGGIWNCCSDQAVKENFTPVDRSEVLTRLAELPITTWNYIAEDDSIRHMGPIGQDFHAAFGLGSDERHISTIDPAGVALVSVQALYELSLEKHAQQAEQIAQLTDKIEDLQARLEALERMVQERE